MRQVQPKIGLLLEVSYRECAKMQTFQDYFQFGST